jgi:methylamine---glutamate N-methyltransferase subunit C
MKEQPDGELTHQENDAVTHGGQENHLYNRDVQAWVRKAAKRGIYDIRGMGAKRKVPHFDDLVFLTASASRSKGTARGARRGQCSAAVTPGSHWSSTPP